MVEIGIIRVPYENLGEQVGAVVALDEGKFATEEETSLSENGHRLQVPEPCSSWTTCLGWLAIGKSLKSGLTAVGATEGDATALRSGI